MCATKGVNLTDAACAAKCVAAGDKYALYTTDDKKVYVLMPQAKVAAHAGQDVVIKGTVDGDTITVTSVTWTCRPRKQASGITAPNSGNHASDGQRLRDAARFTFCRLAGASQIASGRMIPAA